jgi:hypothetical protein
VRCDVCAVRQVVGDVRTRSVNWSNAQDIIERETIRVIVDRYSDKNRQRIKNYIERAHPEHVLATIGTWEKSNE